MAGKGFAASVKLFREATQQRIDFACIQITRELFRTVIEATPVGTWDRHPPGLLVNNWMVGVNNYNLSTTDRSAPDRQGPIRRMQLSINKGIFTRDAFVSLSNSLSYVMRAEYIGWPKEENGNSTGWSGTVGPYRMVAKSLIAVSSKYRM